MADAEQLLSEEIERELAQRRSRMPVAPHGWYLELLTTLLRLDTPTPEAHEHRKIVATHDGLQTVMTWLDVPGTQADARPALDVDVLYGGRLVRRETPTTGRFTFIVQLPEPLRAGATHQFGLILRIPEGQPMRPHYIMTPEFQCDRFRLTVRFDRDKPPGWIRRVYGETVRMFDSPGRPAEHLRPDTAGEVHLDFDNLTLYLGYGAQWSF
ncbi:MAG TPA: hypothetical protein VGD67_22540 [Pseudonocardiaceae bacterium]